MSIAAFGPHTLLVRAPDVIGVHVGSELVLHEPRGDRYVHLNESGELLWDHLAEPRSVQELALKLSGRYGLPMAQAMCDVERLAGALLARAMLVLG